MPSNDAPFHVKHVTIEPWQQGKLLAYSNLLSTYNQRINLVSRRTSTSDFTLHIHECLAFVRLPFPRGTTLVDWGTGGGLPAIPLAIMRPDVTVYAVDSVEKKILAVRAFKRKLELPNLHPWHGRAETFSPKINFSVSRATASLTRLWQWHCRVATPIGALYCIKGGDLIAERRDLERMDSSIDIKQVPMPEMEKILLQVMATVR